MDTNRQQLLDMEQEDGAFSGACRNYLWSKQVSNYRKLNDLIFECSRQIKLGRLAQQLSDIEALLQFLPGLVETLAIVIPRVTLQCAKGALHSVGGSEHRRIFHNLVLDRGDFT